MFTENVVEPTHYECPLDVVFVLDASGSIDDTEYDQMKTFVTDLVSGMDVDTGNTRVGAVTFATNVGTTINLNDHSSLNALLPAITALPNIGGNTYTNLVLEHVRTQMLTEAAGDHVDVPNVVVILTDGGSTDPAATQVSVHVLVITLITHS